VAEIVGENGCTEAGRQGDAAIVGGAGIGSRTLILLCDGRRCSREQQSDDKKRRTKRAAARLRRWMSMTDRATFYIHHLKLAQFGQGSGMRGLPGDFTPPSRFVRAVAFSQSAVRSDTAAQTVLQAFHILNNFDIPLGAVREVDNGQMHAEATTWTSASDLKNLRWYFRTYNDQSIRSVDLTKALAAAQGEIKFIKMDARQPVTDVSANFK
jgi:penicillin V acylase-like amidase (Ntn superfamily)